MSAQAERRHAERQSERGGLRRNRPTSVRSALPLLALLALLAVSLDVALYAFIVDHYQRHGHIGLPLDVTGFALAFTILAVYACIAIPRELRKSAASKHAQKHDAPADHGRSPRKPP